MKKTIHNQKKEKKKQMNECALNGRIEREFPLNVTWLCFVTVRHGDDDDDSVRTLISQSSLQTKSIRI